MEDMARHRRLVLPGVALHVVQRGVDRTDCFREETDRLVYLSALRELVRKTQCALHAYCLMTNHVHMLLTPPDKDACSRLMHGLGRRYVRYFNDRHARTGTLWEGRFRCCLVESAEYVLACHRYIELNPVRAGMVHSACHYPWSSFQANCGLANEPMLAEHAEFTALAWDVGRRREIYRSFCEFQDERVFLSAIREATNKGLPLVGASLKAKLQLEGCRIETAKPGPRPTKHERPGQGTFDLSQL